MSGYFSGYHHQQPWPRHWSERNVVFNMPFVFNSYYYYDHFVINGGGEHLLHHRHQPNNSFAKLPPLTTNLAYFYFHGGIGDGCCGIACRNIEKNTAARPLQLFDALGPIDFQNDMFKIPVIGPSVLPAEASSGTGVFLPVYPKRIRARKVMRVRGGRGDGWQHRRGRRMKQKDTFSKSFVGGDAVEKEECKEIDEIPIELLLPSEWTY
ncbi:hypothetical protein L1987_86661 [Smallanthus sonchifolius]|uniref:Uncharacterized protein n=1 Tax=Smallanthus sonchifolius TaxID=185202 RepID=A0ACB8Y0S9_9ASTR|nr:hypothetical protein L1987_86661 [Smallanthus sonchifolius]